VFDDLLQADCSLSLLSVPPADYNLIITCQKLNYSLTALHALQCHLDLPEQVSRAGFPSD